MAPATLTAMTAVVLCLGSLRSEAQEPTASRQTELLHLIAHDCGSCHGMRLNGGLGPALKPADLKGKSDEVLVNVVLFGRPGTPMPGWAGLLDEADARWLVRQLKHGSTQ